MQQSTKGWVHLLVANPCFIQVVQQSNKLNCPFIFHTSNDLFQVVASVHKVVVHLPVTHQWFILVVQPGPTKWWFINLSPHQGFILVVWQSTKWQVHLLCYPSSTAVHKIIVPFTCYHTNDLSMYCSSPQSDGPFTCHTSNDISE